MLQNKLHYRTMPSPVGPLRLITSDKGLCAVLFHDGRNRLLMFDGSLVQDNADPTLKKAEKQLQEYFAGKRKAFDLPLDMRGTIFQIKAWKELQKIPYGQTVTYSEQASRVGDIKKARAVGMANNRNPLSIIVPCHRVVGASGKLVGYGGGLPIKEFLLRLEQDNS